MIKKINILIILLASLGSIYFVITKDKEFVFIIKDLSVIFTISALYIMQKIFNIKINEVLNLIYILFIFMAHFLGVTVDLYSKIYWFDKFVHFLSGIVSTFVGIYILVKAKSKKSIVFNILFIVSFSMLIASSWEMFEYFASCFFNVDPQKVLYTGVSDTMGDLIVALLGSILISTCYCLEHKENYKLITKRFEDLV